MKIFNQVLYFLLELSMLAAFGYQGFLSSRHTIGKVGLAIGLPLLAALLWGIFAAPRSAYRLPAYPRALFALLLFGLAALALYRSGHHRLAVALAVTALMSQGLALVLKQ